MMQKTCSVCKVTKDLSGYTIRKTHRPGKPVSVCTECKVSYNRARRQHNPDRVANIERNSKFKKAYGITLDDYYVMLEAQNNRCKICKTTVPSSRTQYFAVDHCHTTGKVRGLLCTKCNTGLGRFNDNLELLNSAITYLKGA